MNWLEVVLGDVKHCNTVPAPALVDMVTRGQPLKFNMESRGSGRSNVVLIVLFFHCVDFSMTLQAYKVLLETLPYITELNSICSPRKSESGDGGE